VEIDSTSEMIIEPIDTTKEMVVNGKKYTNSRIKWKKTAKVKKLVENKNVVKTERKAVKIDIKQEKKAQIKNIDKQASYFWLLWFLLLIPLWYFLRRYRII
jgi:predicted RND superfamily exporter protein